MSDTRASTLKSRQYAYPNQKGEQTKCLFALLVEVTGFEPTTSWSRTASAQALLVCRALRFRRTIAAAPPFPTKMLRLFAGAP